MKKKIKLLISLTTFCLAISTLFFGVYAMLNPITYEITGSISYKVNGAFVEVNTKIFTSENKMSGQEMTDLVYDLENVNFENNSNFTSKGLEVYNLKNEIETFNSREDTSGEFEYDQLDLHMDDEHKTFVVVINIKSLVENSNIWAVVNDELAFPDNIEERDNGIQMEIAEIDNKTKNIVIALSIKNVKKAIKKENNLSLGIEIGAGDYTYTEKNLSYFDLQYAEYGYVTLNQLHDANVLVVPSEYNGYELKYFYRYIGAIGIYPSGNAPANDMVKHIIITEGIEYFCSGVDNIDCFTLQLPSTIQSVTKNYYIFAVGVAVAAGEEPPPPEIYFDENDRSYFSISTLERININSQNEFFTSGENDSFLADKSDPSNITLICGTNKVDIPNYIKTIGNYAYDSRQFTEVVIPDTVTTIGEYAFSYNVNLSSITLGSGLQEIQRKTFYGCKSLKYIELGENINKIGSEAFRNSGLNRIKIDGMLTDVSSYAFQECIFDEVEFCQGAEDWIFDDGTLNITGLDGMSSTESWKNWRQLVLNANIETTSIPDSAFYDCDSLREVELYSKMMRIGASAFSDCDSLREVELPSTVRTVGSSAFSDCLNLTKVEGFENVTNISDSIFSECENLITANLNANITTIPDSLFNNCYKLSNIRNLSNITSIGSYAFENCESLKSLTLSNSVQYNSVYDNPFAGCMFESINYSKPQSDFDGYCSFENGVFTVLSNVDYVFWNELWYSIAPLITKFNIPNGFDLSSINHRNFNFSGLSSLREFNFEIPNNATYISFGRCKSLQEITLPSSITIIDDNMFNECKSLTTLNMLSGKITEIYNSAFRDCENLKKIEISSECNSIGENVFRGCKNLEVVIKKSSGRITIRGNAFRDVQNIKFRSDDGLSETKWKKDNGQTYYYSTGSHLGANIKDTIICDVSDGFDWTAPQSFNWTIELA